MVSLSWVMALFVIFVGILFVYYQGYFRPRMYLVLLAEERYMDSYLSKLPHMNDGSSDRVEMESFLMKKRAAFLRRCRLFWFSTAVLYVVLILLAADF